jgi:hypothetical protein
VIVVAAILFAADWAVFEARRIAGGGMGNVAVDRFLATTLKANKQTYDYLGTVNQSCSKSLFPQYAASSWNPPCWWLQRHRTRWEYVRMRLPDVDPDGDGFQWTFTARRPV